MRKILLGIGLLLNSVCAFDVPVHNGYVTDHAGVLSATEEQLLTEHIKKIEAETTAEVALLTIPSTKGEAISSYTANVGQAWGVGKSDVDNGVMIAVAVNDKKWFIATGYGVEGTLPDLRATQVGRINFPIPFRNGQYYDGISRGLDDINGLLKSDPEVVSSYEKAYPKEQEQGILLIACFIMGLITAILSKKKHHEKLRNGFVFGAFILVVGGFMYIGMEAASGIFSYLFGFFFALGGGGNGGTNRFTGSFGSSSRGGGFGGFGGGSFGGGGGGGSW